MNGRGPIDAVVTHHADGFRSGVARFNEILAERLGAPLLRFDDPAAESAQAPLLSFKITEMDASERERLAELIAALESRARLLLHAWGDSPFERDVLAGCARVWGANDELRHQLRPHAPGAESLWAPGLLLDQRTFEPAELSVFSFGMAHKIRAERFLRLRELLEESGRSYVIYISSANHETTTMQEAQSVFEEMRELIDSGLYFMGNLSDVAVYNQLRETTYFAAFFADGVRANNTSVNAAMEQGCSVITNLDEHSPPELVHMQNVIDINRCETLPTDPDELARIGAAAAQTARDQGWDRLIEALG
ncbi:MAG: hypothetical protein H0U42_04695 [Thermoleophilaceae bacterium]|nr:hypothetical protein [Thermoleophilaceae bacterium]